MTSLRRVALVLAALVAAATMTGLNATPAAAATDSCSGVWRMQTAASMTFDGMVTNTSFNLALTLGACASGVTASASGTLSGNCTLSSGSGTMNSGDSFTFVGFGGVLLFTGGVTGVLVAAADAQGNHNCAVRAFRFVLVGTLTML